MMAGADTGFRLRGGQKRAERAQVMGGLGGNPPEKFLNLRWSNIIVHQFLSNLIRNLNFLPVT